MSRTVEAKDSREPPDGDIEHGTETGSQHIGIFPQFPENGACENSQGGSNLTLDLRNVGQEDEILRKIDQNQNEEKDGRVEMITASVTTVVSDLDTSGIETASENGNLLGGTMFAVFGSESNITSKSEIQQSVSESNLHSSQGDTFINEILPETSQSGIQSLSESDLHRTDYDSRNKTPLEASIRSSVHLSSSETSLCRSQPGTPRSETLSETSISRSRAGSTKKKQVVIEIEMVVSRS